MSTYTVTREAVVSDADVFLAGERLAIDGKLVTGNRLRKALGDRGTPSKLMEVWLQHVRGGFPGAQDEAPSPAHADALETLRATLRDQAIAATDAMLTSSWQAAIRISEDRVQAEITQLRADLSARDQATRDLEEALETSDSALARERGQSRRLHEDLTFVQIALGKANEAATDQAARIQSMEEALHDARSKIEAAQTAQTVATTQLQSAFEERDRLIRERDRILEEARKADVLHLQDIAELRDGWIESGKQVANLEGLQKGLRDEIERMTLKSREQIERLTLDLVTERQARATLQADFAAKAASEAAAGAVAGGAREEAERARRDLATLRAERDALVERAVTAEAEVRRLQTAPVPKKDEVAVPSQGV